MKHEAKIKKVPELLNFQVKYEPADKIKMKDKDYLQKLKDDKKNLNNRTYLPPINKEEFRLISSTKSKNFSYIYKISSSSNKDKGNTEDNKHIKVTTSNFYYSDENFSKTNTNNLLNNEKKEKNLKIIQEYSPESKISLRNLELVRKMSEKVKKVREDKKLQLNKHRQTPMERLNNIKRFFQLGSGSPRPMDMHRKFDLYMEAKDVKNNLNSYQNDNIYYYEILYGGNNSEVIENCLKRRNQWKVYQKSNDDYFLFYNNNNTNNTNINNNTTTTTNNINRVSSSHNSSPSNSNNTKNIGQTFMSFTTNQSNENNPFPNFIWSHSSTRLDFAEFSKYRPISIKKMTNHFEFHNEISNKMNLFLNMMKYCESNKLDLFSMLPLTFPIRYESQNYIHEIASFARIFNNVTKYISDEQTKQKYRNLFDLDLKGRVGYKTSIHIPQSHYDGRNLWLVKAIDLNRGRCIKISNNMSGIESIIKHFYKGMKRSFFKLVTNEVIDDEEIEKGTDDEENKNNKSIDNNTNNVNINQNKNKSVQSNNIKLVKKTSILVKNKIHLPSIMTTNNNIMKNNDNDTITNNKSRNTQEKKEINFTKMNGNNTSKKSIFSPISSISMATRGIPILKPIPKTYQNSNIIIQKYIEKPLCYNGRKCDMRLWVMLTWNYNLYLFKEGHFKATSMPYDVNSPDSYVHLTNYSVQKYNKNFAKFETGNEISFEDFEKSLDNKISVKNDLLPKVKDIILHSMRSVSGKINKNDRKICFEIFGYDFIFDENYTPYLLEVNTNPGLEISSPLIEMLIPRMVDDAFKLTIDKIFVLNKTNSDLIKEKPFKVNGYLDDENMWELLGNVFPM